jgi:hypothetical protein
MEYTTGRGLGIACNTLRMLVFLILVKRIVVASAFAASSKRPLYLARCSEDLSNMHPYRISLQFV